MSRSFIGRLVVAALIGTIGALTFLVSSALAAGMSGGGTIITPAQTPTAGTAAPTAYVPTDIFIYFLIILLIFGLLLIAGLLFYIYRIQLKYYVTARSLSQIGARVTAVQVVAFPPPDHVAERLKAAGSNQPQKLKIEGPGMMSVGTPGDFTATDPSGKPADKAQWSVIPDNAAKLNTTTGSKVTANPLLTGSFKLNTSLEDPNAIGEVLVAVVTPSASTEELPFIGQGYGALVIAVLVVVAVIVLALTGTLQGEAVATLLGGLLGYIFGAATSSGTTSKAQTPSKNPNAGS